MANNITNLNILTSASPTQRPNTVDNNQVVNRRLRAQDSINSARTGMQRGGGANSRLASVNGSSALRRGSNSARGSNSTRRNNNTNYAAQGNQSPRANQPSPLLGLPNYDLPSPFTTVNFADSSLLETGFNDQGQLLEVLDRADGTSRESSFAFFPKGADGKPGGHRVATTEFDANGTAQSSSTISVLINPIAEGVLSATTLDTTDPQNPIHISNSTLTATNVTNDNGRQLFNSSTNFADGSSETQTHQALANTSTGYDAGFTSGYQSTITTTAADSTASSRTLETKSVTDEQGFRITTVSDISDIANPVLISTDRKPDPFVLAERPYGKQLNDYMNHVNQQGFLDLTGTGSAKPETDLLLIHRYNKGARGADLFTDIDMNGATKSQAEIEAKLAEGFTRGIYDIDGTGTFDKIDNVANPTNPVDVYDIDFMARYMMGARGTALTDTRPANNDSIEIAADGSNIIAMQSDSPLLAEMQEIFGVDGISLNSGDNELNLFYINLSAEAGSNSSNILGTRPVQTQAEGGRRNRGVTGGGSGRAVAGRTGNHTITRLRNPGSGSGSGLGSGSDAIPLGQLVDPTNYGLSSQVSG